MKKLSKYEKILIGVFLLTLPMINPWVRGDGVGYYAFARAILVQHDLDFRTDWTHANSSFQMGRTDEDGNLTPHQFTATGHIDNHFAIGAAILWMPFLILAHIAVLAADALGAHVSADGFSHQYILAMAFGTAFYGFAALWISFQIARKYFAEKWAFFAALGIWFASSLPVYMYFNPSWSHAHSAFIVALFLWYWLRTFGSRSLSQWIVLGAISGVMMDVYYINAVFLALPFAESMVVYSSAFRSKATERFGSMLARDLAFSFALIAAFSPTLITKKIIYGGFLNFGYSEGWAWNSPAFFKVLFSSNHGFLVWTPILALALLGVVLLSRQYRGLALQLGAVVLLFVYAIGSYQDWDGIASFGNRFCVSLTPIYVIGLASFFAWLESVWEPHRVTIVAPALAALLVIANFGLIFQWGTHLLPPRGPVSLRAAAYNEVAIVPGMALRTLRAYFVSRDSLMNTIEREDVQQLKSGTSGPTP